ncbi:MAG: DUF3088 family protein, partial [Alphaproteobacteria bacterium]
PCGVVLCTVTVITLVASFPQLADRLDVLRVAWPRPRQVVIDLIGRDMVSDTLSHTTTAEIVWGAAVGGALSAGGSVLGDAAEATVKWGARSLASNSDDVIAERSAQWTEPGLTPIDTTPSQAANAGSRVGATVANGTANAGPLLDPPKKPKKN